MRAFILAVAVLLTACQSRTEHGECLGAFDENDPRLVYKASARNLIIGAILIETVVVPVVVVASEIKCPVAVKPPPAPARTEETR